MCGIIGWADSAKTSQFRIDDFIKVVRKLHHRGPDGQGIWKSNNDKIFLGHTRLAVQDLSQFGDQPMQSSCGKYIIVFNGEIYNFDVLRLDLQNLGYTFRSNCDTEVVLVAYQEWGYDCLQHLNGMFAFAILDQGADLLEHSIFIARDRAGEKPLYYMHDRCGFRFASELKALPHAGKLNICSLNHYLALGYVPADKCIFEGVSKLRAAHCAKYFLKTGELRIWGYWQLPENVAPLNGDGQLLAYEAGRLLEDSVRMRMVADVPVGVLLSGGLDSSLIAAAAARVSSRPIKTFTIGISGSRLDESEKAQMISDFLGTEHHVLKIEQPGLSLLDGLSQFIDEPIADSSILPAWLVFKMAKSQVTVALGGDGGDELFGGYLDYSTSLADERRFGRHSTFLLAAAAQIAKRLPAGVRGRNRVASLRGGALQQMIWGRPYFDEQLRSRILNRKTWRQLQGIETDPEHFLLSLFKTGLDKIDRMTRTHFGSILPDDFLFKVDRASMACSLEVRSPMLDHRLIEFCFSQVPDEWKVNQFESRRLQRILAAQWLPAGLDQSRKQGFSIPINQWLREEGEVRLMTRMESLPEHINMDEVQSLVRGHLLGRENGGRLFALIILAIAIKNKNS